MANPGNTIGLDCVTSRNTGTYASPTASPMTSVIDVSVDMEYNVAILKSRASTWEKGLVGLSKGPINIKFLRNNGDADQIALLAAYTAKTMVGLIFADGPIATTGVVYQKGEYICTSWKPGEPLEEGATIDAVFMPYAKSTNDPAWVTVGS
jgi:hypothetical protein